MQIWDTAGQEKFQSIGSAFYRGSDACVLVYDTTVKKSFEKLENWKEEFIKQGGIGDAENFPFIVLGNKCDMTSSREVETQMAIDFCKENGNMPFFETSAKIDSGIQEGFIEVLKQASIHHKQEDIYIPPTIVLKPEHQKKRIGNDCSC